MQNTFELSVYPTTKMTLPLLFPMNVAVLSVPSIEYVQDGNRVHMKWQPPRDTSNLVEYHLNVASTDGEDSFDYTIPAADTAFEVSGLDFSKDYTMTFTPIANDGPGHPSTLDVRPVKPVHVEPEIPEQVDRCEQALTF